jgi:hypothetical protein
MTISKGRLEQIALDVASDLDSEYGLGARTTGDWPIKYAHALLKKVQAECEVVGQVGLDNKWVDVIALPLVSEE